MQLTICENRQGQCCRCTDKIHHDVEITVLRSELRVSNSEFRAKSSEPRVLLSVVLETRPEKGLKERERDEKAKPIEEAKGVASERP